MEKWYAILSIAQTVLAGVISLMAWMAKRVLAAQDDRIREQAVRLAAIESQHVHREEFARLQTRIDDAVSKEEWLRSHGLTQQLLRNMSGKIDEMNGKQAAAVEIASAVAAALNSVRN